MATDKLTENQRAVLLAAARSANLVAWPVPQTLKLSKGSATIVAKGLLKRGLLEERLALGSDPIWRDGQDGKSMTLVITKAGMTAVGMGPTDQPGADETTRMPRAGSKLAMLVALLGRDDGATVAEMMAATGWQEHSVRGVMSGALVKKFGWSVGSKKIEGRGRVYRADGNSSIRDGDQAKGGTKGSVC